MRITLGIEYNGTNYHGWQRQSDLNLPTVQGELERALSIVAASAIQVYCAGRTDVGVHAKEQVVHFDTEVEREIKAWVLGANSNLTKDIRVLWAKEVPDKFHARFSAIARGYRYLIYNSKISSALYNNLVTWHYNKLDADLMNEAVQYLIGEHDFSAFRGADCQSKTPMRNVHSIKVIRKNNLIIIDIQANAFLQHMVRNIVGVLLEIGESKKPPLWAQEVLETRDRKLAGITAPAAGLYLLKVSYL